MKERQRIMISAAIARATAAHLLGVDKAHQPYIFHPLAVMLAMAEDDVDGRIVAVLHDVVEDTTVTLDELKADGFPQRILDAVDAITKRPGETNKDYLGRVRRNPIARRVKVQDVLHNSSPARLSKVKEEKERARLARKYEDALAFLGTNA